MVLKDLEPQLTCRSFPVQKGSRRWRWRILPDGFRGSASMKSTDFGVLYPGDALAGEIDDVSRARRPARLHRAE